MKILILAILLVSFSVCKTIQAPDHSPRINLNKVLMMPSEPEKNSIVVNQNKKGEYFVELNLKYEGSGINVIEGIKSGEIWDHAVVIFDNQGNEIGREPINFQAFRVRTMQTTVVEKDKQFVLSEDGTLFGKESSPKTSTSTSIDPNFNHKIYTDKDLVPQIIKLKSMPTPGTYISVLVELTYVSPFLDELCDEDSDRECPEIRKAIFKKVNTRNRLELNRLQNSIREKLTSSTSRSENGDLDFNSTQESDLKFQSLTSKSNPAYRPRNFSGTDTYCDTVEDCRRDMQAEVDRINSKNQSFPFSSMATPDKSGYMRSSGIFGFTRPFFDQSVTYDGNRLYFREWNLVTTPRFFRVESVSGDSPPVKKQEDGIIDLNIQEESKGPVPRIITPVDGGSRDRRR